jgi:hypothetical protein
MDRWRQHSKPQVCKHLYNAHPDRYCQAHGIQFTRGRPSKKDENAHGEQKSWTHVRKLMGYVRYNSPPARPWRR